MKIEITHLCSRQKTLNKSKKKKKRKRESADSKENNLKEDKSKILNGIARLDSRANLK